jgi:hypothetical protein
VTQDKKVIQEILAQLVILAKQVKLAILVI